MYDWVQAAKYIGGGMATLERLLTMPLGTWFRDQFLIYQSAENIAASSRKTASAGSALGNEDGTPRRRARTKPPTKGRSRT